MILIEKQISFTCADVSILGYECGVSKYPQFYYWYLENYQVLPRPYLVFQGDNGEELKKKRNSCKTLQVNEKNILWMYWKMHKTEILFYIETKHYNSERKNTIKM